MFLICVFQGDKWASRFAPPDWRRRKVDRRLRM